MKFTGNDRDEAERILDSLLVESDPKVLRSMIFELVVATGFWYRKATIHKYLQPLFFLAGFLTCYYLS